MLANAMGDLSALGKMLIFAGLLLAAVGLLLVIGGRWPWFGRLPGDIVIQKRHFTFYFPVVTCIVVSVVLSLLLNLLFRR